MAAASSSSPKIVEDPVSPGDEKLLGEMRGLLAERIAQYWERSDDAVWLEERGLPKEPPLNWRIGNDRFQQLPDDERIFGTEHGLMKPAAPWSPTESALEAEWPDWLLLKFLTARNRNPSQAADMFLRMCLWRDAYGASDMYLMPSQPYRRAFRTFLEVSVTHRDSKGRVIYFGKNGAVEASVFRNLGTLEEYMLNHVWFVEWLLSESQKQSEKLGRRISHAVFVIDLKSVTMEHASLRDIFKSITALDNLYYPELVGAHYVINAPAVFQALWAIGRQLLAPATVEKVHILGENYTEVLCNDLGAENVPCDYGGLCCCRGEGESCFQPKLPIPSYVSHSSEFVLDEKTAKRVETEMKEWCEKTKVPFDELAAMH